MHEAPSILLLLLFCMRRNTNNEMPQNKPDISSTKSTVKKKKSRKKMAGAQKPKKKPKVPVEELRLGGQVEVEARGNVQFAVVRYIGPTHFLQGNIVRAYKTVTIITSSRIKRHGCRSEILARLNIPSMHNIRRDLDWIGTF